MKSTLSQRNTKRKCFGSLVLAHVKKKDVDLLVKFSSGASLFDQGGLSHSIGQILGRGVDVADYQQFVDKRDLMMDVYKGEQNIAAGRVHSTDDVRRAIASDLGVSI